MKRTADIIHGDARDDDDGGRQAIFRAACFDVAEATGANRVGLWYFTPDLRALHCACFHDAERGLFAETAPPIFAKDHPRYFETIRTEQFIDASDARRDPRTRDLTDPYLIENDIHSLLDFIINDKFRPTGVICCENAGARREWQPGDIAYLRQIATLISFAMARLRAGETGAARYSAAK